MNFFVQLIKAADLARIWPVSVGFATICTKHTTAPRWHTVWKRWRVPALLSKQSLNKTACWLLHITIKIYAFIHLLLFQIMGWGWSLLQQSPGDRQEYRYFSVVRYISILRRTHAVQSRWFWLISLWTLFTKMYLSVIFPCIFFLEAKRWK